MPLLGILGGMSWASTQHYYRALNEGVAARLGGLHSARLLLHSVDFGPLADAQHRGDWDTVARTLTAAACGLADGGADALLLATNTMHKVAAQIEAASGLPLLHIADPTARALVESGACMVGLLATAFTMEEEFYVERLRQHGLTVMLPTPEDRATVHRVIYDELCQGVVSSASRAAYVDVVKRLGHAGAEAVILGCTEIGMLIGPDDVPLPIFDTTTLHAQAGVSFLVGSTGSNV